jgi:tetratricopeptide (TPR) repeat protein
VAADSTSLQAKEHLAWALTLTGQREAAVAIYRSLLGQHPLHAASWHLLGRLLLELGKPNEAILAFDEAIAIRPRVATFHSYAGIALEALGNKPAAIDAYKRALRHDSGFIEAYPALLGALAALRQWEDRAEVAEAWLGVVPTAAAAARALGSSLMMLSRFEEARTAFQKAQQLDPSSVEIIADLATVMLACGQSNEAEAMLRRTIESHSDVSEPLVALADLQFNHGRDAEALETAHRSVHLDPTNARALVVVGSVHLKRGEPAAALDAFQGALALNPGMVEWQAFRGVALSELGRHAEAFDAFERLLATDPEFFTRPRSQPFRDYYEASNRHVNMGDAQPMPNR